MRSSKRRADRAAQHDGHGEAGAPSVPGPSSSGRLPATAPTVLTVSATVFVTLAGTGGRPAASRAG